MQARRQELHDLFAIIHLVTRETSAWDKTYSANEADRST
jgi:hypothetical protein